MLSLSLRTHKCKICNFSIFRPVLCYNLSLLNRDYRVMPAKLLVSPLHSVPVVHTQSAHTGSSQLVTLWKKWPLQGSHLLWGTESVREGRDLSKWWFFDRNPVLYLQTQSFSAGQPAFLQLCLTVFMKRPEPGSGGIGELKDLWRSWPFTVTWSQGPALWKHGLRSWADGGVNPDSDLFTCDLVQIL